MAMFSLRILTVDSYQSSPVKGYDVCYSDFRGCETYSVPIIRIFGSTPAGQKGLLHVHGVFPYLSVKWKDVFPGLPQNDSRKYLQELALEIDKALNVAARKSNTSRHHVYNIAVLKRKGFYGFHEEQEDFLRLYFYNPFDVERTSELLHNGVILNKFIQPYDAHFPFILQFFSDYNLFGMNYVKLSAFRFRPPDESDLSPRRRHNARSLPTENSTSTIKIWDISSLESSQISSVPRQSYCELEIDCCEDSIVNKVIDPSCNGGNPGIAAIWDEMRQRKRIESDTSQFTPVQSQERVNALETENEVRAVRKFVMFLEEKGVKLFKKNDKSSELNYTKDSQNSYIPSSLQSSLSLNTEDENIVDIMTCLGKSHEPDDDSILGVKNSTTSDDEDISHEMSQRLQDNWLNEMYPSGNSISLNGTQRSSSPAFNNTGFDGEDIIQQLRITQGDGAFDDENFEKFGPTLLKEEKKNEISELNEEPPVLQPILPVNAYECDHDWMIHCSLTNVESASASKPVPLTDLGNGSNIRSKSKKLQLTLAKKSSLVNVPRSERLQKRKPRNSVDNAVANSLSDILKKVVEGESQACGSKLSNSELGSLVQRTINPPEKNGKSVIKSKSTRDCFSGVPPTLMNDVLSASIEVPKVSLLIKDSSVDKPEVVTVPLNAVPSKCESLPVKSMKDFKEPPVQTNSKDKSPTLSLSSSKLSTHKGKSNYCKLKPGNGEVKLHSKTSSSKPSSEEVLSRNICDPEPKRLSKVSSKESSTSEKIEVKLDNFSASENLWKQVKTNLSKIKKSSINHKKGHSTSDKPLGTKQCGFLQKDSFNIMKSIPNGAFDKFGREIVLVRKLSDADIQAVMKSNNSSLSQETKQISKQAINKSSRTQKQVEDVNKKLKMFEKNKLKTPDCSKTNTMYSKTTQPSLKKAANEYPSSKRNALNDLTIKCSRKQFSESGLSSSVIGSCSKKDTSNNIIIKNFKFPSLVKEVSGSLEASPSEKSLFSDFSIKSLRKPTLDNEFFSGTQVPSRKKTILNNVKISRSSSLSNALEVPSAKKNSLNSNNNKSSKILTLDSDPSRTDKVLQSLVSKASAVNPIMNNHSSIMSSINIRGTNDNSTFKNSFDKDVSHPKSISNSVDNKFTISNASSTKATPITSKAQCEKSLNCRKFKRGSKHKQSKKLKCTKDKKKSGSRSNKKLSNELGLLKTSEIYEKDLRKDAEGTFDERCVTYFPETKAVCPVLSNLHEKDFIKDPNLISNPVKQDSASSQQATLHIDNEKTEKFHDAIIRNSPFVKIEDCSNLLAKYVAGYNQSPKSKTHKKSSSSKNRKKSNPPNKGNYICSKVRSVKNKIKLLPTDLHQARSPSKPFNFKDRIEGYPKLDVTALPVSGKSNLFNSLYTDAFCADKSKSPFAVKSVSSNNSKLEGQLSPCSAINDTGNCTNKLPYAVKSKPLVKSFPHLFSNSFLDDTVAQNLIRSEYYMKGNSLTDNCLKNCMATGTTPSLVTKDIVEKNNSRYNSEVSTKSLSEAASSAPKETAVKVKRNHPKSKAALNHEEPTTLNKNAKPQDLTISENILGQKDACVVENTLKRNSSKKKTSKSRSINNPLFTERVSVGEIKTEPIGVDSKFALEPSSSLLKSSLNSHMETDSSSKKFTGECGTQISSVCIGNEKDDFKMGSTLSRSSVKAANKKAIFDTAKPLVVSNDNKIIPKNVLETKSTKDNHKPKLTSSEPMDFVTNDLYDIVKRRTASKCNSNSNFFSKSSAKDTLNNNITERILPALSKVKSIRKSAFSCKSELTLPSDVKSNAKVLEKPIPVSKHEKVNLTLSSALEKTVSISEAKKSDSKADKPGPASENSLEKPIPAFKVKESVPVSEIEKSASSSKEEVHVSIEKIFRSSSDPVITSTNKQTNGAVVGGVCEVAKHNLLHPDKSEPVSFDVSTSSEVVRLGLPSGNSIPSSVQNVISDEKQLSPAPQTVPSSSRNLTTKSILTRSSKGKAVKKNGSFNNFGFFSSKTPQRNRRCQNDVEGSQCSKTFSSKLSLKSNRRNSTVIDKIIPLQPHSMTQCGVDNKMYCNDTPRDYDKSHAALTTSSQHSSEAPLLNTTIKKEPCDDYEMVDQTNIIKDSGVFDFNESSNADPILMIQGRYSSSSSKQAHNKNSLKSALRSKSGGNKVTKAYKRSKALTRSSSRKSSVFENTLDSEINNSNNFSPNLSTKQLRSNGNCSTDRYPKRNRSVREDEVVILAETKALRRTRNSNKKSAVSDEAPTEVIDVEQEDDSMCIPKVIITIDRHGLSRVKSKPRSPVSSNNATESPSILQSKNSSEDCMSSPDSKHDLKIKIQKIMTRNNKTSYCVQNPLEGINNSNNDSDRQNHPVEFTKQSKMRSSKLKHSSGEQSSGRKNDRQSSCSQYENVPIKPEPLDDYERKPQQNVNPLQSNLHSQTVSEVKRTKNMKLCFTLNNLNKPKISSKRKHPSSSNETSNVNDIPLKHKKKGWPAKVQKLTSPHKDMSPLKHVTSFNRPGPEQEITDKCSHMLLGINEECTPESGPITNIKEEPPSDNEDGYRANAPPVSHENKCERNLRRRSSLQCDNIMKGNYSGSKQSDILETKSKLSKAQKKTRSKSTGAECDKKNFGEAREVQMTRNCKTGCNSGFYIKFFSGGDSDDYKEIPTTKEHKTAQQRKRRQSTLQSKQRVSSEKDAPTMVQPCSVNLERLSSSDIKNASIMKENAQIPELKTSNRPNLDSNSFLDDDIQLVHDSTLKGSQGVMRNRHHESSTFVPPFGTQGSVDLIDNSIKTFEKGKNNFEILHSKVISEKNTPLLISHTPENAFTKFISDSGPVTINGLNSIDIDSNLTEFPPYSNCPPYLYTSPPLDVENTISVSNSGNFLRRASREMDQCVFENSPGMLKNSSMDCQSPLLYSQSPIMNAKNISEFSPDNKYLHLGHSSPHADLIHSPMLNSETTFENSSCPMKEFSISNKNYRTSNKDFSQLKQQGDVNSYYSRVCDSSTENQRSDSSMVPKKRANSDMFDKIDNNIQMGLEDFSEEQHQNPFFPFETNSVDHTRTLSYHATEGLGDSDKMSNGQCVPLKPNGNSFDRRKENINSCFSHNYHETSSQSCIPEQTRQVFEGSNQKNSDYSSFSRNYDPPIEVRHQPSPFAVSNQNKGSDSFHASTEEPVNVFGTNNDYLDRIKWEDFGLSNDNDSFHEVCEPQSNNISFRQDQFYHKTNNNGSGTSKGSSESFYRSKWQETNTSYFPCNDRINEFSPSDKSFNRFSCNNSPLNETFRQPPSLTQLQMNTYKNSFSKTKSDVPRSTLTLNRPKSNDVNFPQFINYDCNSIEPNMPQVQTKKNKYSNTYENMEMLFRPHGLSSENNYSNQNSSPIPHSSPELRTISSPFKPESKVIFKKELDCDSESNDCGYRYSDICGPSPNNTSCSHMEAILSPNIDKSPASLSQRSENATNEFKVKGASTLLVEPSINVTKNINISSKSVEDCDLETHSPNSSLEVITISSESDDAMSESDFCIKSVEHQKQDTDISTYNNKPDTKRTRGMSFDPIQNCLSFNLLSGQMVSEESDAYLMNYSNFSHSPQSEPLDNISIPLSCDSVVDVCTKPEMLSSVGYPSLDTQDIPEAYPLRIIDLQETLIDSNSENHPLGSCDLNPISNFLPQNNNLGRKQSGSNFSVPMKIDPFQKYPGNSVQVTNELYVGATSNANVITTTTPISSADSSGPFVPLQSFKSIIPVVPVNKSVRNETLCYSKHPTSSNYNPITPTFLPTLMVNESVVVPQSDFFFNNASFIISNNSSSEEDCINFFQNPETLQNCPVDSILQIDSKSPKAVKDLKKQFSGEEDILSMIVKSCDIGEEFDENFDSPGEIMNNFNATQTNSAITEEVLRTDFNNMSCLRTIVEPSSIPISCEPGETNAVSPSSMCPSSGIMNCGQKSESKVNAPVFSHEVTEYNAAKNKLSFSESSEKNGSSQFNQCLESYRDGDSIQDSTPLDSIVHSFYGEDSLYDLNPPTNCDSLSFCSNIPHCDTSSNETPEESRKSVPKLNIKGTKEETDKRVAIIPPSQSSGLPGNGNHTVMVEPRNTSSEPESSKQISVDCNGKLEVKQSPATTSDGTAQGEAKNGAVVMKPDNSPPHFDRLIGWTKKPGDINGPCSSPEEPSSDRSECSTCSPTEDECDSVCDDQQIRPSLSKATGSVNQPLVGTPSSSRDHGVLRQLLSTSINLESTPSSNRPDNRNFLLEELGVSPISKNDLLTSDTKRKRRLSFDGVNESSKRPESKRQLGVLERSWKNSVVADQSRDSAQNVSCSEIDGPTLINSRDFRVNIEDCERVRHEAQHLTIMSLEIHVNTRNNLRPDPRFDAVTVIFYSIYYDVETFEQEVVGVIALDKACGNRSSHESLTNFLNLVPGVKSCEIFCVDDEKSLFEKLSSVVREWDPDMMVGYEIQMASWGYLIERASALNINLISMLSRLRMKNDELKFQKVQEDHTVTDQTADMDRMRIPGRIVLNLWRLIRKEVTLNVYTFENVYYHVLHRRIPHYSFQDLTQWFLGRQRETVVRFYVTRTIGTIQLLEKLDIIRRTSELARLFGIQFYEVLSRGSQFRVESMMLRTAAPIGYVPVSPSARQRSHSRAPECVPLILEPESKFYQDPVVVLDFQSLYPSMIIAYNYCYSTCLGRVEHFGQDVPFEFGCTSLNVPNTLLHRLAREDNIHISPQGIAFVKRKVRRGVLPIMLEEILDTRVMVKQSMKKIKDNNALKKLLDARQLGLKLIANVTYGYTGASFSGRMPCVEVADSIVGKARETLERAIRLIENTPEWQAKVVYGDTDSLFILLPGRSKEEAFTIGYEIADAVTAANPKPVKLKFEKVYLPCVLQTKKRYVGFMYETVDQQKPIFDAKGIETVRRDSCPATAKILETSLKILFAKRNVTSVKSYVQKQFSKILTGRMNAADCIFAKEYRGINGYRPGACVPALEIAKRRLAKDPRSEPRPGERVPYVVVYGFPGLPIIRLVHEPSDLLMDPSLRINATYYITRVISPPLERVFSLLGANVKSWFSDIAHTQKLHLPMTHHARETITQYFATRNCPSCESPTTSSLCENCRQDRAGTAVHLQDKIRKWERAVNHLNQICLSCTKSNSSVDHCSSLDCPILFKLNLAKKDFSQAPYLRKILSHELF